MHKLRIYLLLILPIALMSSNCKKNKNDPDKFQVLKGRIMENCTTPYASKLIKLSGDNALSDLFCVDVNGNNEFYTDANGYFEITFRKNGNWGTLYAPYKVITFIPIGSNECLDIGEVNLNGSVNFLIQLQANSSYTINDTLIIPDYNSSNTGDQIKIAGPFSSGVIDTVMNRSYTNYPLKYSELPRSDINYYFTGYGELRFLNFNTPFCQSNLSEVLITID
jgi:hypothetical protein